MTYPESELYAGIQARLLDTDLDTFWTNAGHVKPATVGIYNKDYDEAEIKLPFNRPAVFVEFEEYPTDDRGGVLKDVIPVTVHVVQDIYVTGRNIDAAKETAHKDLLKYATLVRNALHKHNIDNVILSAVGVVPDHDHQNLLVHKVKLMAIVRSKFTNPFVAAQAPPPDAILFHKQIITPSEVKNSYTNPVEILQSPGADKLYESLYTRIYLMWPDSGGIEYATYLRLTILQGTTEISSAFDGLAGTVKRRIIIGYLGVAGSFPLSDYENKGIYFSTRDGNPENGNSPLFLEHVYRLTDLTLF